MPDETALIGWTEICHYLRRNLAACKRKELKDAGIIFYRKIGFPPDQQRWVYTFPSLIHKFLSKNKDF